MLKNVGKLLKYEFLFYFRILPPLYLVLVLAALFAGFQTKQSGSQGLLAFIWGALSVAITVINFVLIIQRFRDNFLKNPGYLMFTLPVTTWALTASKALAAFCMVLMSSLTIVFSAFINTVVSGRWPEIKVIMTLRISGYTAEIILTVIVSVIMLLQLISLIYAVITASHMLPRFRFAVGIAMYFVIVNFVEQPVFRLLEKYTGSIYSFNWSQQMLQYTFSPLPYVSHGLASLAFAALFLWAAGFQLKNNFNLE